MQIKPAILFDVKNPLDVMQVALEEATSIFVLCDENTIQHCWPLLAETYPILGNASLLEVPASEESKDIQIAVGLWQSLLEQKADRKSLFINLGGGVVCDLGGFVASTYKRGIPFINIPTSLLAMVDAGIGGKTGLDLDQNKNIIGTFAAPQLTLVDPFFLKTLAESELRNGFAEMIKHALIQGADHWKKLKTIKILSRHSIKDLIEPSLRIKEDIVLSDPLEKSDRKKLNLGHSIAHALESLYMKESEPLSHGEAVAHGLRAETRIANQMGICTDETLQEIEELIQHFYGPMPVYTEDQLLPFLINDKKNQGQKMIFTLLQKPGEIALDVEVNKLS